jgi:hypothetical protein
MKNILTITMLCLLAFAAGAQKIVEKQAELSPNGIIRLNIQIADSIKIVTWNKSTVYAKASININENKDNDYYNVSFDANSSSFEMKTKFEANYHGCCGNCNCNCNCNNHDSIYVVVYVPENTDVVVETINGDITISGKLTSVKAKSISGFVDVAVSPEIKADLRLSTISGKMYSDLDLETEDKNLRHVGGSRITKELNGGGKLLELETISGDIFLRKG